MSFPPKDFYGLYDLHDIELAAIYYALRDLPEEILTEAGLEIIDYCKETLNEGEDNDDGGTYGTDASGEYDLGDFYRDAPFDLSSE